MKKTAATSNAPACITIALGAVSVLLYLFAVAPASDALARARRTRGDLEFQLSGVHRDLKGSDNVRERLKGLEESIRKYEAGLLKPLLGSWAMRAKSLLDPLADGCGLESVEYAELPLRALPLTQPPAKQLYARRPIRMTCSGSYAALVSFLLRVERDFPLVSVQAFKIVAQRAGGQLGDFVFEWPSEGALSTPPAAKGGKGK